MTSPGASPHPPMPPMAAEPVAAYPVAERPPRRPMGGYRRMAWAVAISIVLHALAALPMARWTADETIPPPREAAQPAELEVLLSDPSRGAAPEEDTTTETRQPEAAETAAPAQPDTPATPPQEATEAPAQTTEPPPPEPAPPDELALPVPPPPPPAPSPAPTPAPAPQRAATQAAPPPRLRPGASLDGREDGRTEIVIGDKVVPPSQDPGHVNIPPRYPLDAARRGQQGEVTLNILVATDGSVLSVEVSRSSGYPALDRAAREAALKWHFRPGTRDGMTIPTTVPYTLVFQMGD